MIKTRLVLIALVFLSGLTSIATITKVFARGSVLSATNLNPTVQEIEVVKPTDISTSIPASRPQSKPTLIPTIFPTAFITPKPTVAPTSNSNLCIITLQGQQYNVTTLRSSHSGGDIFKCGTDMSALYSGKHGSSLARMQAYLYLPGSTPTNPTSPTSIPATSIKQKENHDDDNQEDREDEEHENRYIDD